MVIYKIKLKSLNQFAAVLILVLLSSIAIAKPQLNIYTDKVETEIGRPIRVELIGISLTDKLADIKLDKFNRDFGVVTDYSIADASDPRWPDQTIQILHLKLYPRKSGNLTIPTLNINGVQSKKVVIKSTKGKTSAPKITLSSSTAYIRQQIIAHVSIVSSSSTARLSISEDDKTNGFESQPLAFKRTKQNDGRYLLQIGWALSALKIGTQQLQLPVVDYSVSGVARKRFFLPAMSLNIKSLPAYLPATIPVGEVKIQSEVKQRFFLPTNSLHYWELTLDGKVNNSYRLPPILRQIKNNNTIRFLPINSEHSVTADDKTLISNVSHSIPFKASTSGWLSLPDIRFQYFDPESGKIQTFLHQAPNIFVLSPFWLTIVSLLVLLFVVWLSIEAHKKWKRHQYSKSKYQQALTLLKEHNSNKVIREALKLIAQAEYWIENLTITQWCEYWKEKYKTDSDFENNCKELSDLCYQSQTSYNLQSITQKMIVMINTKARK